MNLFGRTGRSQRIQALLALSALLGSLSACGVTGMRKGSLQAGGAPAPAVGSSSQVVPAASGPRPVAAGKWVSGYYVGYQQSLYPADSIDFSSMTHLIIGRVVPNYDATLNTTFDIDSVRGPAMAKDLVKRAHAAGVKAIVMLGGEGVWSWPTIAADGLRPTFVANLLKLAQEYGFDGFDLDWEPLFGEDAPKLKALVRDLRTQRPDVVLSLPIPWINANFPQDAGAVYAEIAPYVDQLNIMSYQMVGNWTGWQTWHTAALFGESPHHPSSIDASVQAYEAAGVPAAKIGMGIGFYGLCFGDHVTGPGQEFGGDDVKAGDNVMSYRNIMGLYYTPASERWDDAAKMPYLVFSSPTGPISAQCTYISYENEESVKEKGKYARARGIGGTIVWTINQGYRPGQPSPNALLKAVGDAFLY